MTMPNNAGSPAGEGFKLIITRHLRAPREAVFRAWTDPEALVQWFGPESVTARLVSLDPRPGGRYSLEMHGADGGVYPLSGEYREVSPPSRLVFTWIWGSGDFAGVETLVTVNLDDINGETRLTLTHERLANEHALELHNQGWTSTLGRLERLDLS